MLLLNETCYEMTVIINKEKDMIKHNIKLIDIVEEAAGTKTYYFEKPEGFTWEEGAHTHIAHVGFDAGERPNRDLVRHMSIMTLPEENRIGITTRFPSSTSKYKSKLAELKIGDEMVLFKLGSVLTLRRQNRPVILLSMGVGIAAMRPIILAYKNDKTNVPYIINVNVDSSEEFIYREELDKLQDENYSNHWVNSRKEFYEKLEQLVEQEDAIYYIVGSYLFDKDVIQRLVAKNVKAENILIDKKEWSIEEFLEN
jgi:ferredoxin--NADP+ reductase